jgi:hypothetical protein
MDRDGPEKGIGIFSSWSSTDLLAQCLEKAPMLSQQSTNLDILINFLDPLENRQTAHNASVPSALARRQSECIYIFL